jgi:hypothetical protein
LWSQSVTADKAGLKENGTKINKKEPPHNGGNAGQSAIRLLRQNTVELLVLLEIVIRNVEYYNDYSVKSGTIRNRLLAG